MEKVFLLVGIGADRWRPRPLHAQRAGVPYLFLCGNEDALADPYAGHADVPGGDEADGDPRLALEVVGCCSSFTLGRMPPPPRISRDDVLVRAAAAFAAGKAPSMGEIAAAAGVSRAALYGLFGSRRAIVDALRVEQPPPWRDRVLMAGAQLLAERGLSGWSLDEVAARSGASRSTVYRLFPGKAALFREVVRVYLPLAAMLEMLEAMGDRPPAVVMPALATSLTSAGHVRIGVLRSVLFEVTGRRDEHEEVIAEVLRNLLVLARYVDHQMAAGRLRPMDPLLAIQSFVAPIVLHIASRPLIEHHGLVDMPLEEAVREFTHAWLEAMAPPRQRRRAGPPAVLTPARRRRT
ncbi:MAG: TetR/AcrR family transcriptional regulator [Actinomycetota bacterium]